MNSESGRRQCEFQLLRYVPDAIRNEFVHIGVILREQAAAMEPRYVSRAIGGESDAWIRKPTPPCSKAWRASYGGGSRMSLTEALCVC
jgi:hypothetical protein